jgi:hypothetical protein
MAFTSTELQEWVKGLELSADDQKIVLEKLGSEKVITKVGTSIMAQRDYSRGMDELKAEKTRIEADLAIKIKDEEKKSADYMNELGGWKRDREKVLDEAVSAREQAEQQLAAVQTKIKQLAPTYAIPESELSSILTSPAPSTTPRKQDPPREVDTGKFVSKDDFNHVVMNYAKLPAIMVVIEREHARLFGPQAEMPDFIALMEEAPKNKLTLHEMWERKFKVPERRAEIAKTAHDAEILAAEKRGAEAATSKMLAENPGIGNTVRRENHVGSPVLDISRKNAKDGAPNSSPSPARGVEAAIAAFGQGTYRTGT